MTASIVPQSPAASPYLLEVRGVSKRFGGTSALTAARLAVREGSVHAFLGANGAGKSTLIRILADVYQADAGVLLWRGQEQSGREIAKRTAIVHQDLGLIDFMTVGENMAMGYGYPRGLFRRIDWKSVNETAARVLAELVAPLPLDAPVSSLGPAEKSLVAIARAISRDVKLLILDEPTASLPEADVERLFKAIHKLRERGVAIVYVTHRLDEVFRIADAATVIRDGRTIGEHETLEKLTAAELVTEIVGHVPVRSKRESRGEREPILQADAIATDRMGPVSLTLGRGEILGLAGLRAQGHEETGRLLAGVQQPKTGTISLEGQQVRFHGSEEAIRAGIGFATGRRAEEGVARGMTVRENLFLNPLNFKEKRFALRSLRGETERASRILAKFAVKPRDPNKDISTLSGGNQQKVVLARWAGQDYKIVVLEDPTIGVDIGAKSEIYKMMLADCEAGTSYVVVSSDIEELVEVCDRVLAFSKGEIVAELKGAALTMEALTHAVSGARAGLGEPKSD